MREHGLVGARVGIESRLRIACLVCGRHGGAWLVGGSERALAVPSVARPMLIPEWVRDGADGIPENLVVGPRIGRRGRHPFEVGEDIGLADELLPVGRLVGTNDGGVVFGAQPCPTLV